ncbi:MAG TPA: hypothetical protein VGI79_07585 [Caulobacteraceae bacterium]
MDSADAGIRRPKLGAVGRDLDRHADLAGFCQFRGVGHQVQQNPPLPGRIADHPWRRVGNKGAGQACALRVRRFAPKVAHLLSELSQLEWNGLEHRLARFDHRNSAILKNPSDRWADGWE